MITVTPEREAFEDLCLEAFNAKVAGQLTREKFQEYFEQALTLVGRDYEVLHGLTSLAPFEWQEEILE
jgi:hypothetical protein